jgi:formylglycine-generating enzyme required for sulfatase activity
MKIHPCPASTRGSLFAAHSPRPSGNPRHPAEAGPVAHPRPVAGGVAAMALLAICCGLGLHAAEVTAPREKITVPGLNYTLVKLPRGTFIMGNDSAESDERPAHQVTLTKDFWYRGF